MHREDCEVRHLNTVIREDHLGQGFVMGERQPAWIATRIRLLHQLKIADDVLVVKRVPMKLFEQIKGYMGLVLEQRCADDVELVVKTNRIDLVAHTLQS